MKVYKIETNPNLQLYVKAVSWSIARRDSRRFCRKHGIEFIRVKLDRASTARFIQLDLFEPKTPIDAAHY